MSFQSAVSSANQGVFCDCGFPSPVNRSWTRKNPGRRFYGCKGRRQGSGYINCGFFRWYDDEILTGWKNLALSEAQTIMEDLKHEIGDLKCKVTTITLEAVNRENAKCEALRLECEAERREVLVLKERCNGLRNVLLASSIGFAVCIGGMMVMWTSKQA